MSDHRGLTRRDLLKRGGLLGAVAWATPVVQVVGMRSAHAMSISPGPCTTYCIKWETDRNPPVGVVRCNEDGSGSGDDEFETSYPLLGYVWTPLGAGRGNCIKSCPGENATPSDISQFRVYGDPKDKVWVSFPDGYQFAPAWGDGSGDDVPVGTNAAAKCGQLCNYLQATYEQEPPCEFPVGHEVTPGTRWRFEIPACQVGGKKKTISHIELLVQKCPS